MSYYYLFSKDHIAEMVDIWGGYLKLGSHAHILCSLVQLLSCVMADFCSTKSVHLQDSKSTRQVGEMAFFEEEMQGRVHTRSQCNYDRIPSLKLLCQIKHGRAGSIRLTQRLGFR